MRSDESWSGQGTNQYHNLQANGLCYVRGPDGIIVELAEHHRL